LQIQPEYCAAIGRPLVRRLLDEAGGIDKELRASCPWEDGALEIPVSNLIDPSKIEDIEAFKPEEPFNVSLSGLIIGYPRASTRTRARANVTALGSTEVAPGYIMPPIPDMSGDGELSSFGTSAIKAPIVLDVAAIETEF
ncbi:MAG TPA: hypothetical protein VGF75_02210, partial [Candidatus Saccharimonadales bacterium]